MKKNYLIGILVVTILVLASFIYKYESSPVNRFPVLEESWKSNSKLPLYFYFLFSRQNCLDCLKEVIQVLNQLPSNYNVIGIVPGDELLEEQELRQVTGAAFPLVSRKRLKRKYKSWFTPTLIGISQKGEIVLVLPGLSGGSKYLEELLHSLYVKFFPLYNKKI